MTTYESTIQTLHCSQEQAFELISDLTILDRLRDLMPADKLQDMVCDTDSCTVTIPPIGLVTLRIIERESPKTVKLGADNLPINFNLWIQLKEIDSEDTKMKLTLKVDIPLMLKPMIGNKAQDGVQRIAESIAMGVNKLKN